MKPSQQNKKIFFAVTFLLGVAVGICLYKVTPFMKGKIDISEVHRVRLYPQGEGHLSNPLMQVEGPSGGDDRLERAQHEIETYIEKHRKENDLEYISVYLRRLDQGTWIGINENEKYTIASLIKVPLLFSFYVQAQKNPSVLNREITFEQHVQNPPTQNIIPKNKLELGKSYTIGDLLERMIVFSDNDAMFLLMDEKNIDSASVNQIFTDLRLPVPGSDSEYYISAKDYASYFRLLYNATYLNKDLSQKALELLAHSDFRKAIVAGVPENVTVAHKFGERKDPMQRVQLHDCGIIYPPGESPYLLCVMSQGWNFEVMEGIIRDISKMAYTHLVLVKG